MRKKAKKSLLEQIYDNDLIPPGGVLPSRPEYSRACGRAEEESTYLMSRLSSEDQAHLDELIGLTTEMESYTAYANFAFGLRCGATLMRELTAEETI